MLLGILDTSATPPQFLPLLCHLKASPGVSLSLMEAALGSRTASITLTAAGAVRPTAASPPLTASKSEEGLTGQELWLPQ